MREATPSSVAPIISWMPPDMLIEELRLLIQIHAAQGLTQIRVERVFAGEVPIFTYTLAFMPPLED